MFIKKIRLESFRNYEKLDLELSKHKNIIIGENAQGKTNLLESIYFCSFGKSFRNHNDADLIKSDRDYFKIILDFFKNGRDQQIEVIVKSEKLKQIKKNGVKLKTIKEIFATLNVIFFSPDDLRLIKASPLDRRKFIDREISNIYPIYVSHLIEYNKVLANRNALLKNFKNEFFKDAGALSKMRAQIEIWDLQLASYGVKILQKRFEFIKSLSPFAVEFHRQISSKDERLELFYECSIDDDAHQLYGEYINLAQAKTNFENVNFENVKLEQNLEKVEIKQAPDRMKVENNFEKEEQKRENLRNFSFERVQELFLKKLSDSLESDIRSGSTKYGIHKDDLGFEINGLDAKKFASQGQQRTAILAIKMAQIEVVKRIIGDYPILLLDDVMSELDPLRQSMLLNLIKDFQCIISTTDLNGIHLEKFDVYKKIVVKNGIILS